MAKNASEAMRMLSNIGFSLININLPIYMEYKIIHKYKPIIYIPIACIDDNITFMLDTSERFVVTSDGIQCKVTKAETVNIINNDSEIQQIYGMKWYEFAEKWNRGLKFLRSIEFFRLELDNGKQ